jgi:hypothetical protein
MFHIFLFIIFTEVLNSVESGVKHHHPNLPLIDNMIEIPQRHDTTEIVLKVALNTIALTYP